MTIPQTIWVPQPQNLEGEFNLISALFIVDPTDSTKFLVDPVDSTEFIVSTTSSFTGIAATAWVQDDSNE